MERLSGGDTGHATDGSCNAAANAPCMSRSEATHLSQDLVRAPALGDERRKRGNVRVPLDESRQRAEAIHGASVQLPHGIANLRAMVIDEEVATTGVAGEMDFTDAIERQAFDELVRVEAEILRAHVHVVDVEQQPAAGRLRDRPQEFPLFQM